jgi:hypothetical protein
LAEAVRESAAFACRTDAGGRACRLRGGSPRPVLPPGPQRAFFKRRVSPNFTATHLRAKLSRTM